MERYLQRNLDGSTLLYEDGRTQTVPAGATEAALVQAMLAFYTPASEANGAEA
jgi:hypothetical protein